MGDVRTTIAVRGSVRSGIRLFAPLHVAPFVASCATARIILSAGVPEQMSENGRRMLTVGQEEEEAAADVYVGCRCRPR